MSIYHTLVCAMPRLQCPPNKNAWLPSDEQMQRLLSPLDEDQRQFTEAIKRLISEGYINKNIYSSRPNLDLKHFLDSLNAIVELAKKASYQQCVISPQSSDAVNANIATPSIAGRTAFSHPWITSYESKLKQNAFNEADRTLTHAIWQLCDQALQQQTSFTSVLAMYTQWLLCFEHQSEHHAEQLSYLNNQLVGLTQGIQITNPAL